ncbi:MAG: riboflavin synthase [Saprospiraceae bacterium]
MFTGIIETTGVVEQITHDQSNLEIYIKSSISQELKIDQSIAHNGVCLTVDKIADHWHRCTLIKETLDRTHFHQIKIGDKLNLERSIKAESRMDGHFVQGHIDTITTCNKIINEQGSWVYNFELPDPFKSLVVEKGSICINGVSLTISKLEANHFEVSIIPYTFDYTNFNQIRKGSMVNIEFDILGKYIRRILQVQGSGYLAL